MLVNILLGISPKIASQLHKMVSTPPYQPINHNSNSNHHSYHFVGLELAYTIASITCRSEPTGQSKTFAADVVATAKRNLKTGEKLDGEGGYMVHGKLMTAMDSLRVEALPVGLAHGVVLKRDICVGEVVSWRDVEYSLDSQAVGIRREMERLFRGEFGIGV